MKHFLFFYYLITGFSGLVGYFCIFFLVFKSRYKFIFYYFVYYTALSIIVFVNIYQYYRYLIIAEEIFTITWFVSVLFLISHAFLFLSVPRFIYYAIEKKLPTWLDILSKFFFLAGLAFIAIVLFFVREENSISSILSDFDNLLYMNIFFIFLLYTIYVTRKDISNVRVDIIKNVMNAASIITIVFLPLFIIDLQWDLFQIKWKILPRCFNFTPLYYFLWNVFTAYYFIKFIALSSVDKVEIAKNVSENFIKIYRVGKREQEILHLVLLGMNNKEIADRLFISESTVRNHISNIYQKTGANNRIELIKILQNVEQRYRKVKN